MSHSAMCTIMFSPLATMIPGSTRDWEIGDTFDHRKSNAPFTWRAYVLLSSFLLVLSQQLYRGSLSPAPSPPLGFRHPNEGPYAVSHSIFPDYGTASHFEPLISTVLLLKRTDNQKWPENHSRNSFSSRFIWHSCYGKQYESPSKNEKQNYHLVQQSHLWYVSKGIPHTKIL